MDLKLKVCGMLYPENIQQIAALNPDYLGFIFFEKSKRNVIGKLNPTHLPLLNPKTKRVGVFVNESFDFILSQSRDFNLDTIQLHGEESPILCQQLKRNGLKVFKVFSVDDHFDFSVLNPYKSVVDYFLFDTKGKARGGTGKQFNWSVLKKYDQEIPFILSGGISLNNMDSIKDLEGMNLYAVDVNSQFEIEPGRKDPVQLAMLKEFLNLV